MNVPNLISLGRLASVPLAVWLILNGHYSWAFWLFIAAGVSDAVDGFVAKRFGQETVVGKYLDPLADKALLISVFITLGAAGHMPLWLVIIVVSRDVMILAGALIGLILTDRYAVQPMWPAKVNTVAQIVYAGLVLANLGVALKDYGATEIMGYVVAATSLFSLGFYIAWWLKTTAELEDDA